MSMKLYQLNMQYLFKLHTTQSTKDFTVIPFIPIMFSHALHVTILFWFLPCIFCNNHSRLNLDSAHLVEDKAHLKQHVDNDTDVDNMSAQEVRFKYFISHDFNNDYRLDGLEIIQAILHYIREDWSLSTHVLTDEVLVKFLDPIFERDDRNDDGFLDYLEFMSFRSVV